VDDSPVLGVGTGGTTALADLDGTPVFVKRIPLTDLERVPSNVLSTANLFGVPTWYQYGLNSAGAGAWRELAAHVMTTNWVLANRCANFPLLYHWRVLDGPSHTPTADEPAGIDGLVRHWHDSAAVRERLTAIATASASVVLFCEYVPHGLHQWLTEQTAGDAACGMVARGLLEAVSFMNASGLVHFDAHFGNIRTDGDRLYLTDFGLATAGRFELSADELAFLRLHRSHDGCYTMTQLVNHLVVDLLGTTGPAERNAAVRRCAEGTADLGQLPTVAASVIRRYAPVAVVVNDFYWRLRTVDRRLPYPVEDLRRACATSRFDPGFD
jgi:hypothetical protein